MPFVKAKFPRVIIKYHEIECLYLCWRAVCIALLVRALNSALYLNKITLLFWSSQMRDTEQDPLTRINTIKSCIRICGPISRAQILVIDPRFPWVVTASSGTDVGIPVVNQRLVAVNVCRLWDASDNVADRPQDWSLEYLPDRTRRRYMPAWLNVSPTFRKPGHRKVFPRFCMVLWARLQCVQWIRGPRCVGCGAWGHPRTRRASGKCSTSSRRWPRCAPTTAQPASPQSLLNS